MSKEGQEIMQQEIVSLLEKSAIEECLPIKMEEKSEGQTYLYLATYNAPKPGGKKRPVINCQLLNSYMEKLHFKMEGLHGTRVARKWRLDGAGFKRCILPSIDPSRVQKSAEVQIQRQTLPIQSSM